MHARRLRLAGATDGTTAALRRTLVGLRAELGIPEQFPPDVVRAAELAAAEPCGAPIPPEESRTDRRDLPLVTLDPAGSQDLDQAFHLARDGEGFLVHYAIADVAAFVPAGGPVDAEAHHRGVTLYGVDVRTPLHPPVLSEGAASLLPGVDRPAALWTVRLAADGALASAHVERAVVRSRRQLAYDELQAVLDDGAETGHAGVVEPSGSVPGDAPRGTVHHGAGRAAADLAEVADLLRTVGTLRQARERARGGVSLDVPEQVVVAHDDGTSTLEFRSVLPVESWNAQLSLLVGIAAARLMVDAGAGVLRTLPAADPRDVDRLRLRAGALGVQWPDGADYADVLAGLDPRDPRSAAFRAAATTLFRGAAYQVLGQGQPVQHAALATFYAHVTAPLRRLVDRFGTEVCLALCAGSPVPAWVSTALPELPAQMAAASRREGQYQRACLDAVEAALLTGREGEVFPATAVEDDVVQILAPAVEARIKGAGLTPGSAVRVRVESANIPERALRLTVVPDAGA